MSEADTTDTTESGADDGAVDATTARTVLEYVVKALVEDPDAVSVELDDRGRRPALNVHVGDGDMGRVIGKRGRVAQSIRTVVRAAAVRDGLELDVEFVD
ncbi:KH domain-containing protein [Rhabdothermincola salaria]|uniref:KH domain-containing protein n=1 Tax=Rhabdothermincola salaria TaxID=2903142 RepID=UPI001E48E6FD|nr:KH domain-containing protein [Rhabdothermincola salaria]